MADQGLEQDFNSLDAQYDAFQSYIRSQAHAGWTLVRGKYDDGSRSGQSSWSFNSPNQREPIARVPERLRPSVSRGTSTIKAAP